MRFQPFPILTAFCLPVLALLIYLGSWQYQRMGWKADKIAAYIARSDKPAATLDNAFCGEGEPLLTAVTPSNAVSPEWIRVFGKATSGQAGWRIFTAVKAPDCVDGALLAETAFQPYVIGDEDAPVQLIDRLRVAPMVAKKGAFSNANNPDTNEWYWFDVDAMEEALFVARPDTLNRDYVLFADDGPPEDLTRTPPERHLGYSITWFGMAIVLIVLYAAFHIRAGRLSFGQKRD